MPDIWLVRKFEILFFEGTQQHIYMFSIQYKMIQQAITSKGYFCSNIIYPAYRQAFLTSMTCVDLVSKDLENKGLLGQDSKFQ